MLHALAHGAARTLACVWLAKIQLSNTCNDIKIDKMHYILT